jgi:hypothetical protein
MKSKLTLYTKLTGEIVLNVIADNKRLAEIPMGTDPKEAVKKADDFCEAIRGIDGIENQIT